MNPTILLLPIVAFLWGITNNLMKRYSEGIERCTSTSLLTGFLLEIKFLIQNWKYLMAYALNQCGSALYYYSLGSCDLSIAGPLTNTLTFIVTYLSGKYIFGEDDDSVTKKLGIFCVCCGITIILYDKL